MEAQSLVDVFPEYGWGWRKGAASVPVPAPFIVQVTEMAGEIGLFDRAVGTIVSPSTHEYAGQYIILLKRGTLNGEALYNVLIKQHEQFDPNKAAVDIDTTTGFAKAKMST
jgi:hypothetical protein